MKALAKALLGMIGYKLVGRPPEAKKCVVIFAPHTSNWDFIIMLLVRTAFRLRVAYLGKHTLFRFPFGWFFRWTGGIPVERSEHHQMVSHIAHLFAQRERLWLAIAPEGTRSKTEAWKTGFYHIALSAKVPVLCTFLDSHRKECGVLELVELTGDTKRDVTVIRQLYANKRGILPERQGEIRF